jgi:glycosyltransferase involved in cell wall biosynthesis
MDTDTISFNSEKNATTEKLSFAYVGAPAKKDYLKEILEGFHLLDKEYKALCELHVIGVTESQLINVCGVDETLVSDLNNILQVHGRLPHEEAIKWVREADYTLLLRDAALRYAKAGFPTKIVESLSCGTPPICNFSSDLEMYLKDGENAFISQSHRPEDLKNTLTRAIESSLEQRNKMRKAARMTAEESFDYRNFIEEFKLL